MKCFYIDIEMGIELIKREINGVLYVFRHGAWHVCNSNLRTEEEIANRFGRKYKTLAAARKAALSFWVKDLKEFKVQDRPMGFNSENMYYEEGAEKYPFWSEGYLYPLLGKEEARTLLAKFRRLKDISEAHD